MASVRTIQDMITWNGEGSIEFSIKFYASLPSFCKEQFSGWQVIRGFFPPFKQFQIGIFINTLTGNCKQFSVYSCIVKSCLLNQAESSPSNSIFAIRACRNGTHCPALADPPHVAALLRYGKKWTLYNTILYLSIDDVEHAKLSRRTYWQTDIAQFKKISI